MNRELMMAAVAALSLAACSPDLSTSGEADKSAGPAATESAQAAKPGGTEVTVARAEAPAEAATPAAEAEKGESATPAAGDGKEDDKKDDGEKKPQ